MDELAEAVDPMARPSRLRRQRCPRWCCSWRIAYVVHTVCLGQAQQRCHVGQGQPASMGKGMRVGMSEQRAARVTQRCTSRRAGSGACRQTSCMQRVSVPLETVAHVHADAVACSPRLPVPAGKHVSTTPHANGPRPRTLREAKAHWMLMQKAACAKTVKPVAVVSTGTSRSSGIWHVAVQRPADGGAGARHLAVMHH